MYTVYINFAYISITIILSTYYYKHFTSNVCYQKWIVKIIKSK